MKRVLILGSPGSGKSTFSRKLGKATGLPVIHLDFYFHDQDYDYYNDKEAWAKRAEELTKGQTWIMDGNYTATFQTRFKLADTMILLNCSRPKAIYRVIKRRFIYSNKRRPEMPENWEERFFFKFLTYVWQFNRKVKPGIIKEMKKHPKKQMIILNSFKEADEYISKLK